MIASALLVGFALLLWTAGPAAMRAIVRPDVTPALGVAAWQVATISSLLSFGIGAALLCRSVWDWTSTLNLLERCLLLLTHAQSASPVAILGLLGLAAVALVAARLAWFGGREAWILGRDRRRQRRSLALLARPHASIPGVLVFDRDQPSAFCLPQAWRGDIFVTTAALAVLSTTELTAVLAHERAHLRGHHAAAVIVSRVFRDAFPFVPLFRAAADAVPVLVEMVADDVAARSTDRRTVASALLRVAEGAAPATALGAGGSRVGDRVRRLLMPAPRRRPLRTTLVGLTGVGVLALPAVLAVLAPVAWCPFAMPS